MNFDDHKLTLFLWSFVSSGLIIYFSFCFLTYIQNRQRSFLYYGLYNFFLFIYIMRSPVLFSEADLNFFNNCRYLSLKWFIQIIYNSLLYLFYVEFLDIKIFFPKFYYVLICYIKILIGSSTILLFYCFFSDNSILYNQFFNYFFIPLTTFFVIIGIYFGAKTPNKIKYFIIIGIILYQVFAYTSLFLSSFDTNDKSIIDPIAYFYIGIIIESIIFMLCLGYKVKMIYLEKIKMKNIIINEQKKVNLLIENYKKRLENELAKKAIDLQKALQKSEFEKLKSVTFQLENEISNLKLEALRSQMNPHFIFNALNSIKAYLINNDKESAIYYLNKFSKLIRKILESSRVESISLQEELEIIELYIKIENIRFEKEIHFSIVIDENVNLVNIKIPALILQPFIENSLWHGLNTKKGNKTIEIKIFNDNKITKLVIIDNGIGRKKSIENASKKSYKKKSLGLEFSQERITFFNKKNQTNYSFKFVDLFDNENNSIGTQVDFIFKNY